jgi:hypothetical protein
VIAFDLPLGHGVIGPGADMPYIMILEVVFKLCRDEAGPVVYQEGIKKESQSDT